MNTRSRVIAVVALLLGGLLQIGCATSPAERMDAMAREHGLIFGGLKSNGFRLRYYRNRKTVAAGPVRIYLEGDGLPWLRPNLIARDPTTRNPVALRLMLQDPGPAIYLGRPCYHQLDDRPLCTPWHWTAGRYSGTVVDSMAAAIERLTGTVPASTRIGLVGYSGGGALALLLAQRLPQADHVITIAGNLDPSAWTALHGYSPLSGSENPSRNPPLRGSIRQLHLVGGKDVNLPPSLIEAALRRQGSGWLVTITEYNHHCCWPDIWPSVLESQTAGTPMCERPHKDAPDMSCLQLHAPASADGARTSP